MDPVGLDIEVTPSHLVVGFHNFNTDQTRHFVMSKDEPLDVQTITQILRDRMIVSFNGRHFDLPILFLAMKEAITNEQLKKASDSIITLNLNFYQFSERYNVHIPKNLNHIDLIDVTPNIASLKIYGGRIHCEKLQDMPIDHTAFLNDEQVEILKQYNLNDLQLTKALYIVLKPQIELREKLTQEYGIDLRSKSDAQIAESIITAEVSKVTGPVERPIIECGTTFKFKKPGFIEFKSENLNNLLNLILSAEFVVPASGQTTIPKEIANTQITIGNSSYQIGIGGLHSTEQSSAYIADENTVIIDRDVVSYYPSIILREGIAPEHMADSFLHIYRSILNRRLKAKKTGDKVSADALKIVVNSSFGKFGSKWSKLYSPNSMIQTTLIGQLALLMLIESLELEGVSVISANTDGVVIKHTPVQTTLVTFVIWMWETQTGFETEESKYRALYCRDVNNYICIKTDGSVKRKGAFAFGGLQKNPTNEICIDAVTEFLRSGIPIEETIDSCKDIRKFVTLRRVNNGAIKDGVVLGRAIRWYYANGVEGVIHDKINNYTIPRTEGAKPLMDLPVEFPNDVNLDWYKTEAYSMLEQIGSTEKVKQ